MRFITIFKFLVPIFFLDVFFRRLPYAKCKRPQATSKCPAIVAELFIKPGDILLCKGFCTDSCVVSAWSLSEFTHIAIIGPDLHVYDITPVEHERRMTLPEYVNQYEGYVCWRPIHRALKDDEWGDVQHVQFREGIVPYLGATCSENRLRGIFESVQNLYSPHFMYCSEYVVTAMKLENPRVSHPMNFAPGGKFDFLFEDKIVDLN